jgi:hypothetical protein
MSEHYYCLEGASLCAFHAGSDASVIPPTADCVRGCDWCGPVSHRAWLVVDGAPLRVRHAADAWFAEDDMGAHDMAHARYLQMHFDGVRDAY